ncbi:MAG: hypothetical protein QMC92_01590, partial [Methanothermobacter wolfeii]|nr:hypothetical protein [Methanothermobacter wolfeii]
LRRRLVLLVFLLVGLGLFLRRRLVLLVFLLVGLGLFPGLKESLQMHRLRRNLEEGLPQGLRCLNLQLQNLHPEKWK